MTYDERRADVSAQYKEMRTYFSDISKFDLATIEQEIDLCAKAQAGDTDARDQMIKMNLKLVVNLSKKFSGRGVHVADLISAGNIALFRAIQKYDGSFGFKFSTYSSNWIKQAMQRTIESDSHRIRIPSYMNELKRKVSNAKYTLMAQGINNATLNETLALSSETKNNSMITGLLQARSVAHVEPHEALSSNISPVYNDPTPDCSSRDDVKQLMSKVQELSEREQEIVSMRFGLNGRESMTLQQIADTIRPSVTRERIRQLVNESIVVLRWKLRDTSLDEDSE